METSHTSSGVTATIMNYCTSPQQPLFDLSGISGCIAACPRCNNEIYYPDYYACDPRPCSNYSVLTYSEVHPQEIV